MRDVNNTDQREGKPWEGMKNKTKKKRIINMDHGVTV